jgi:maltooligosyltrehalose trehalohydrolase
MKRAHRMPFGAEVGEEGTGFRLWAPGAHEVELVLGTGPAAAARRMAARAGGWFAADVAGAVAGTRYAFRIDGGLTVPDPAARANPDGVHAASEVIDPGAYAWADADWRGRPWHEAVVYELHVGTFTPEGTFAAASARLDALTQTGVTAIELMPVAAFPGARSWGYDGVLLFAPAAAYGRPDDLKRLVDAAHARGLMVLLDVVYNHFGPEGNYLHVYAPAFFNPRHATPWGAAINFDGAASGTVREFFVHNALYWLHEFHLDGLRLDAVHAIADDSRPDIVSEIAQRTRTSVDPDRHVHLVLENDRNQAHYLARDAVGRAPLATAQWNDDLHHAAHVIVSGETDGYYADYAQAPVALFARALAEGFVYVGQPSAYRGGERRGEPSAALPPAAFVSFLQNHDQVGNRAYGERVRALADDARVDAVTACILLAPQVPLLFMGEEFAATAPFLYFCDFGPELASAVRDGRRAEFARFARFGNPAARAAIPDPAAPSTYAASKLDWRERERAPGLRTLTLYRTLLAARRRHVVPFAARVLHGGMFEVVDDSGLHVQWTATDGRRLHLLANLGPTAVALSLPAGERIAAVAPPPAGGGTGMPPGTVVAVMEAGP